MLRNIWTARMLSLSLQGWIYGVIPNHDKLRPPNTDLSR